MRLSIRTKLILAIGAPLAAIYLCVLWLDYREGKDTALRDMKEYLEELVAHHAAELGGRFSTVAQVAQSNATFLETRPDLTEEQIYDLLRNVVRDNPQAYGACMAFEPNAFRADRARFAPYVCRAKTGRRSLDIGREGYDYLRWDWYLIPKLLQRPIWTDPYYDEGAGNALMCTYSIPFKKDDALWGIATVDISIDDLRKKVAATKMAKGYSLILGRNGVFISHPDESLIMRETIFSLAEWHNLPILAAVGRKMISGQSGIELIPDYLTGAPKWLVFAPIRSSGWSFAAVLSDDVVMAPVYEELRWKIGLIMGGLVLIVAITLLTATHITRPVSRLAKTVSEVAAGNLDVQATDIRTHDEIGDFARAFNKMVADLKAHVEALTREISAREAVESELRIARTIQTSLLPRVFPPFPDRDEFALHAVNVAAKQVAGDFFDFYFVSDEKLLFTIADVSGKGVPAGLFMAVAQTLLKNLAMSELGPGDILGKANQILVEDNDEYMFVTLFLGLYDTKTGRLHFANAGHPSPYHLDARGNLCPPMPSTGPILGVMEGREFGEKEVQLNVGDTLVLYTDGVTEAHSPDGELYGENRFEELVRRNTSESVERLCGIVVDALDEFQKGDRYDDVTLLVFRRSK